MVDLAAVVIASSCFVYGGGRCRHAKASRGRETAGQRAGQGEMGRVRWADGHRAAAGLAGLKTRCASAVMTRAALGRLVRCHPAHIGSLLPHCEGNTAYSSEAVRGPVALRSG